MSWIRRTLMVSLAILPVALATGGASAASPVTVDVWKSPSCGCCGEWVKHLEQNGFHVAVHDTGNAVARARLGVPAALGSCHTAKVGEYAIEGHVPAADIRRLLAEAPHAVGLAAPGMPAGAPGMEQGNTRASYDVLLVKFGGATAIFESHGR